MWSLLPVQSIWISQYIKQMQTVTKQSTKSLGLINQKARKHLKCNDYQKLSKVHDSKMELTNSLLFILFFRFFLYFPPQEIYFLLNFYWYEDFFNFYSVFLIFYIFSLQYNILFNFYSIFFINPFCC